MSARKSAQLRRLKEIARLLAAAERYADRADDGPEQFKIGLALVHIEELISRAEHLEAP